MGLNRQLQFQHADNEYIPIPKLKDPKYLTFIVRIYFADRAKYPEGAYRMLDYLRVAVEMFVAEVRKENKLQEQAARRAGREYTRFTWRNKGELAVCFACCCDMLKLFYDTIQPGPLKPVWDSFVGQFIPLLMSESGLSPAVLTEQTYNTKYMDWQKGGTRYGGDQTTANVRFPSAQERRTKVETYLRTGAGYKIEAVSVPPAAVAAAATAAGTGAHSAPAVAPATEAKVMLPRPPVPAFMGIKGGPGAVRPPPSRVVVGKGAVHPPAAPVSSKQMPEELHHLYWLSGLAHIKGSEPTRAFPEHRIQAMTGFVRLCEMTHLPEQMLVVVAVVRASAAPVQRVFEQMGGLVAFRNFAQRFAAAGNAEGLMELAESMVHLRLPRWSEATQRTWRTNDRGEVTPDLTWLRVLKCIPAERRAAWGATVLLLEEKFLFSRTSDQYEVSLKRPRTEGEGDGEGDGMEDMMGWDVPRVFTLMAPRLPVQLRAPPLSQVLERSTVGMINSKRRYAEEQQGVWAEVVRDALRVNSPADSDSIRIPLWYEPLNLIVKVDNEDGTK